MNFNVFNLKKNIFSVNKIVIITLLFNLLLSCESQQSDKNTTSLRSSHFQTSKNFSESKWDSLNNTSNKKTLHKKGKLNPKYKTFGWHLYSNGSSYKNYNFDMLWGISYFSYAIKPETGTYKSIHQWKTTTLIDSAKAHNCKVFLSVSNFGRKNNSLFLNNIKSQETLISNLIDLLAYRKANGINIDFEGVSKKDRKQLTAFIILISKRLKEVNPTYMVSLCLYANDWNNVFNIKEINPSIDFYTLMGYDYYGSFSKYAGPISPLKNSEKFGNGLENSVTNYLKKGAQPKKLIVGLPYYGAEWYTTNEKTPSKVKKFKSHPAYKTIKRIYIDSLKIPLQFDTESASTYLSFKDGNAYREIWFEDIKSLAIKYDWIKNNNIGGVGIWALGYDDGYPELWNLLVDKFSE
jgi:spore germination protein YaaH